MPPGRHIEKTPLEPRTAAPVRMHVVLLAAIAASTALLRFAPRWVMSLRMECVLHAWLHVNCPFCGMTRDFAAILHGQAPQLNPFSWMAFAVIYAAYPGMVVVLWWRRRLDLFFKPAVTYAAAFGLVVMMAANNLR